MKIDISPVVLDQIKRQYNATKGRSNKKKVVQQAADHYGISYSTMIARLDLGLRKRKPSKRQEERIAELNLYGRVVWAHQQKHTKDDKACTMRAAYRYLQSVGQIPMWFKEKQCYDAIERQNLSDLAVHSYKRYECPEPHDQYQMDFTKSNFLKYIGNDTILLTDGRWSRGEDDLYVWIGGAIDDRSRVVYYEYILTPGENATMTQQFIVKAMQKKHGMMLLQGMPKCLYVDRGPGFEAGSTGDGLMRLGVTHIAGGDFKDAFGNPSGTTNKQARGKIENFNKFVKSDFEQELKQKYGVGRKFSLSELNAMLHEWCEWQNQQEHPQHPGECKWHVFERSLAECRFPEHNALARFAKSKVVRVSRRLLRWGKDEYYKAPSFIGENMPVELLKRQDECYGVWEGAEIKLLPQESPYGPNSKKALEAKRPAAKATRKEFIAELEKETDRFEWIQLRERFDKELRSATNGDLSLERIPRVIQDDMELKKFFSDTRSLADIKEFVEQVRIRLLIPTASINNSKVIASNVTAYR